MTGSTWWFSSFFTSKKNGQLRVSGPSAGSGGWGQACQRCRWHCPRLRHGRVSWSERWSSRWAQKNWGTLWVQKSSKLEFAWETYGTLWNTCWQSSGLDWNWGYPCSNPDAVAASRYRVAHDGYKAAKLLWTTPKSPQKRVQHTSLLNGFSTTKNHH